MLLRTNNYNSWNEYQAAPTGRELVDLKATSNGTCNNTDIVKK